jgi:hypothetical protein
VKRRVLVRKISTTARTGCLSLSLTRRKGRRELLQLARLMDVEKSIRPKRGIHQLQAFCLSATSFPEVYFRVFLLAVELP